MSLLGRILDRLFPRPPKAPLLSDPADPHLVFVTVPPDRMPDPSLSKDSPSVQLLLHQLQAAARGEGSVSAAVLHGELTLTASGPDADKLFAALEPVLRASPLIPKAYALLRYGGIGAREVQVAL